MAAEPPDRSRRSPAPGQRRGASEPPLDSVDLPLVGSGEAAAGDGMYDAPTNLWDRDNLVRGGQQPASGDGASAPPKGSAGGRLEAGDMIGTVRVVEVIASGERVSTWRAQRRDGTSVTVHALYPEASRRERETFQDAANRQDGLNREHPFRGIAPVSRVDPGRNAYVVDVAAAGTMDDLPMLSWALPEKLAFFRKMAAALGAAHSSGVIHGCLRPAGVLLDDEELAAVLSDVGTIKLNDSYGMTTVDDSEYAPFTAPEVRKGKVPDVASDIYSLGRCLYFLLLGQQPRDPDEEVPLLESLKDEPKGLERIVRKCTVRDPTQRYRRVDELLDDLTKYQNHQLVGTPPPAATDEEAEREGTPPPRASEAAAPKPKRVERPAVAAAPVARPKPALAASAEEEDPLARVQLIIGAIGLGAFVLALVAAYFVGRPSVLFTAAAALAALAGSFIFPALGGRPLLWRGALALVCVVLVLWLDPAADAAIAGRRAKLTRGSPEERAAALLAMKERGVVDFSGLDLSEIDLSGKDLAFVVFDDSKLQGAKLVGTRLEGCSMGDADLSRADLSGADISGVDISTVIGWDKVRCDDETVLPPPWLCISGLPQTEAMGAFTPGEAEEEERPEAPDAAN